MAVLMGSRLSALVGDSVVVSLTLAETWKVYRLSGNVLRSSLLKLMAQEGTVIVPFVAHGAD